MGRWSYVRIKGKTDTRLLVVTVYQVCKAPINTSGDSTAFTQQWNQIRATGDDTPNPRVKFTSDLSDFLAEYPNDPIILAGDINSWLGCPNDDKNFENLVRRHNLKDVLIRSHGPDSEIPTRKEGRRIDYIFASEIIADNTTRCAQPCTSIG
jgi:endonuclease/exonuclease/phosphatase family metal-dependent hydrolase